MSAVEELLKNALKLPAEDRALLVAELDVSLEAPPDELVELSPEWLRELERRAQGVIDGTSQGSAWDDVRARLHARYGSP
jgi:putative addiction module component (TIGR02574 family)